MKKNNISVDFIIFGDLDEENTRKLEKFNEVVKSSEGCHLAIIPPGPSLLSDHIASSPIVGHDGPIPGGDDIGGGADDFEFGVDPNVDPDLAMALQMSVQDEKARQEKATKDKDKEKEKEKEQAALESVPEETEAQPLLDQTGEPSGSGSAGKEDKGDDDEGKMDTT